MELVPYEALKDLELPPLGGHLGPNAGGPLVTKTLSIVNSGARDVPTMEASNTSGSP